MLMLAELLFFIAALAVLIFFIVIGERFKLHVQRGWYFIVAAFSLLFLGASIEFFDSFEQTELGLILNQPMIQIGLKHFAGYAMSLIVLLGGSLVWAPTILAFREKYLLQIKESERYYRLITENASDMLAEHDSTIDIRKIHSLKTGKLIQSAITCAARLQDSNTNIDDFEQMGWHIGMAFQITDDILEFTQTSESLGKSNLSDAKNQKLTYVSKFGIEESKSEAQQHIQSSLEIAKRCLEQPNRMMDLAKMVLGRTS